MEYQNRFTCFIDLLGFKAAVDQTLEEPKIATALFDLFEQFRDAELEKIIYGTVPLMGVDGWEDAVKHYGDDFLSAMDNGYDLVVTQFSDSFVISAPADNPAACMLMLRALRIIEVQFFFGIGMLMRGGISIGKLVHRRGGALFGPAMNEAYAIESKLATYPRVVFSDDAFEFYSQSLSFMEVGDPFVVRGFDGVPFFDLVSCFLNMGGFRGERSMIYDQLKKVEQDIIKTSKISLPKISYLLNQWSLHENKFSDDVKTEA